MSRIESMSICLVGPSGRNGREWPLPLLREHLRAAGHEVEVRDRDAVATDAEVVHAFGWTAARDSAELAGRCTWIVTPSPSTEVTGVGRGDVERLAAAASSVVVRSSREQEEVHRLGVPWFRTWVLPVGVDAETFSRKGPMANRTERLRLVTQASGDGDGADDVLAALTRLDDVELVLLLGGSDETAAPALSRHVDELRAAARSAGVSERFAVVAPPSAGERAWWLRSAHVAVAVPHAPMAHDFVAEAMSCGAPVVATPVDALFDLVVHGVTGFHVPVGEPVSLARAVRALVDDDFAVEAHGMAAADRALSRFAWPRVAHELAGIYHRVAQGSLNPEDGATDDEGLGDVDLLAPDDAPEVA